MPNDHLPVEMPESVGTTTSMPDIHSDIQQNNASQGASGHNINRGRSGRRGPQLMWYEGEEYYEEPSDYDGPTDLVDILLLPPSPLPITILPAAYTTTARVRGQHNNTDQNRTQILTIPSGQHEESQDLGVAPGFVESLTSGSTNLTRSTRVLGGNTVAGPILWNLPVTHSNSSNPSRAMNLNPISHTTPTFLNASGEIDLNLIPHAPRTDLPPPPPLVPLPRLTEEPPASWFEGMSEDSKCPVLSQPDYVVEYSFPCGHALCRWCYEQICLASNRPVCPLCRRRI